MQTFSEAAEVLFLILQLPFALYMMIPFLSVLIYGVLKLFGWQNPFQRRQAQSDNRTEFGIIITAHQETRFIFPLVDSILKQTYPDFYVYIVADDCDTTPLVFPDKRIMVIKPPESLHSKIRSIRYGLSLFRKKHDAVIILDADNLIHPEFLMTMNNYFQKGYKVVQADFKPKNTDSAYARMDAIGDMFNFFIEREVRMELGMSSAIWGSGVAIDIDLYNEVEYTSFLGGFDKKLQSHLVQRVDQIAFAREAILYDEKITSGKSLETQRTRWLSSYFKYFKESLSIFFKGIRKLNFNLIYFGFITLRPPLFIVFGMSILFTALNYFINFPVFIAWLGIIVLFILSFMAIIAIKGKKMIYFRTLFMFPFFMIRQFMALLKIKKARKSFLKTEHSKVVFIDDLV